MCIYTWGTPPFTTLNSTCEQILKLWHTERWCFSRRWSVKQLKTQEFSAVYCNFSGAVMYLRAENISSGMSEVKPLPYVSARWKWAAGYRLSFKGNPGGLNLHRVFFWHTWPTWSNYPSSKEPISANWTFCFTIYSSLGHFMAILVTWALLRRSNRGDFLPKMPILSCHNVFAVWFNGLELLQRPQGVSTISLFLFMVHQ